MGDAPTLYTERYGRQASRIDGLTTHTLGVWMHSCAGVVKNEVNTAAFLKLVVFSVRSLLFVNPEFIYSYLVDSITVFLYTS